LIATSIRASSNPLDDPDYSRDRLIGDPSVAPGLSDPFDLGPPIFDTPGLDPRIVDPPSDRVEPVEHSLRAKGEYIEELEAQKKEAEEAVRAEEKTSEEVSQHDQIARNPDSNLQYE